MSTPSKYVMLNNHAYGASMKIRGKLLKVTDEGQEARGLVLGATGYGVIDYLFPEEVEWVQEMPEEVARLVYGWSPQ